MSFLTLHLTSEFTAKYETQEKWGLTFLNETARIYSRFHI